MKINAMTLTNGTLTVIVDNGAQILTAREDHPKWIDLYDAYKSRDEQTILSLISLKSVVEQYSVGALSVNSTGVTYNGKPIHSVDTERVMSFLREGLPYQPIANYMARKMLNPSARAINELYAFLEHKFMPITPEGMIISYKGVLNNYYSKTGNKNTVVIQGVVNSEGQILNRIGDVIEIERSSCDDDFRNGCSFGLHAGSLAYATGWSDRVILVEIDPKDVVSVPADGSCQKLRCCKYKVIGEYTGALPSHYTNEFSSTPNSDDNEDDNEEKPCPECHRYDCCCDEDEKDDDWYEEDEDFSKIVFTEKPKEVVPDRKGDTSPATPVSDIESRVIFILSYLFMVDKKTINVSTPLSEFQMDSLDIVELTMGIEEEFNFYISEDEADKFNDQSVVEDIINYVRLRTCFVKSSSDVPVVVNSCSTPWTDGYNAGSKEPRYSKYIPGDEDGADSENHRVYIKGYLAGYASSHKTSSH